MDHAGLRETMVAKGLCATVGLFLLISLLFPAHAQDNPTSTVSSPPVNIVYNVGNPPLKYQDSDGQAAGILMDLWRLWSDKTGVPLNFTALPWDQTLQSVKQGSAGIHAGLFYTEERDQFLDYANHPLLELDYHFYHHRLIGGIRQLEDLAGLQIGVPKGYTESFMRKRLPNAALIVYDNFPALYAAADRGEIKAFISPSINYQFYLKQQNKRNNFIHYPDQPVYTRTYLGAVQQGNEQLLEKLNQGLKAITAEERAAIEQRWLGRQQTDTEALITLVNPRNTPPLSMFNEQGESTGILNQLWQIWARANDHQISIRLLNEEDALTRVVEGRADASITLHTSSGAPDQLLLSDPLFEVPVYLYSPLDAREETTEKFFGIAHPAVADHLTNRFANDSLRLFDNTRELIRATDRGAIQGFISDKITADYALLQTGKAGQYQHSKQPLYITTVNAVVRSGNDELLKQINDGFKKINNQQKLATIQQWLGEQWNQVDTTSRLPLSREEQAWLERHPKVEMGVDGNWPPIDFMDQTGQHRGVAADYLELIAERLGIEIAVSPGPSFKQMLEKVQSGELKAGATITPKDERKKTLLFTQPYTYVQKVIISNLNNPAPYQNLEALNDKTVAVEDGFFTMRLLQEQNPLIHLKPVDSTLEALRQLSWGNVDAYVGNQAVAQWLIRKHQLSNLVISGDPKLGLAPQSFAVSKSDPEWAPFASILDKAMDSISDKEKLEIESRWLGSTVLGTASSRRQLALTREEKQWLRNHPEIRLGIDPIWPPVEYFDRDGTTYLGMASDVVNLIAQQLDVHMTPVTGISWKQVHSRARQGEIDLLPAVTQTASRDKYLDFTKPYLVFPQVIFVRTDANLFLSGIDDLRGKQVVVESGYVTEESLKRDYPDLQLVAVNNTIEALQKLSAGEVDAYVGNLTIGSYLITEHGLNNIKVAAPTPYSNRLSIGVRKDWPELLSIVQKALNNIRPEEMANIRQKWMKVRYEQRVDYSLLWKTVAGALVIIAMILIWLAQIHRQRQIVSEAKDQAIQASRFKSEFLANMSHEIRTPMNAIVGLCHLTARTELNPKQKDYLDKIQLSAQSLLSIINDILDFSKIEAGKLKIETVDFELEDVLQNLATLTSLKASEKGLEIVFEQEPNVPTHLMGDPFRLGQVLLNLVSNAIKFTSRGDILIKISLQREEENQAWLLFEVIDSGIGLSKKQQKNLFSPFTQADGSTTRKYGGTGLGLSISRQLINLMGGDIGVESEPKRGSRFYFTLPYTIVEKPKIAKPKLDLRGMRVLLVDDNKTSLEVLSHILESLSFEVTSFDSGRDALRHLRQVGIPYDLILLDWVMPELDGVDVAKQIREIAGGKDSPIIIMVTAYGREMSETHLDEGALDSILVKPITPSQLFDAIIKVKALDASPTSTGDTTKSTKQHDALPKLFGSVLLAEDNAINQQVARELLEQMGLKVDIARNGKEAVNAVGQKTYDAVLMDIQMPEMDGYQATAEIRDLEKHKNLPIIALTANALSGDREKALNAGMNEHIPKPIDPRELYNTLSGWLPQSGEGTLVQSTLEDPDAEVSDLQQKLPDINVRAGIASVGGKRTLYEKLAVQFYQDHGDILIQLEGLLARDQIEAAIRAVHTIKGVAGNIGAKLLQQAATEQEEHLHKQKNPKILEEFRNHCIKIFGQLAGLSLESMESAQSEGEEIFSLSDTSSFDIDETVAELKQKLDEGDGSSLQLVKKLKSVLSSEEELAMLTQLEEQVGDYDFEEAATTLEQWHARQTST